jgi:hypothetical protein
LQRCEAGFIAAEEVAEFLDATEESRTIAENVIDDAEIALELELSRSELEAALSRTVDALRSLVDSLPSPTEVGAAQESLYSARTELQRYLVQRQAFILRLNDHFE